MGPCMLESLMSGSPQKTKPHAGEAETVNRACPIKSPFTAVSGVEGKNGQKKEGAHHARSLSHDTSDPEGNPLS